MRRTVIVLTAIALAPLLMGGGGPNPPPPGDTKITGPAVSAVVVLDPHDPVLSPTVNGDNTQKAKQASIRVQKGSAASGATFRIPSTFQFASFGCGVTKTDDRFVNSPAKNNRLIDWIPSSIIDQLFADLGIAVTTTNVPVITDVDNVVCTHDPENAFTNPGPGILSFQALIQFQVPQ